MRSERSFFLALSLALLGALIAPAHPWLGVPALLVATFMVSRLPRPATVNFEHGGAPRQAWEPWFLAALLLLGTFAYSWKIGSLPQGADYSEGWLADSVKELQQGGGYKALDNDPRTPWPTIVHYQGMLSAKLFGPHPASYRLPSAIWALLALAAFYLCARLCFSPGTAAALSLFWLAFHLQILYARRFLPVAMTPLPILLGLGGLILGLRSGRKRWFILAGLGLGLTWQVYIAARLMPLAFFLWSVWALRARRGLSFLPRRLALTWAVGLLVAAPVLISLWSKPSQVLQHDQYVGKDQPSVWAQRLKQVPAYLGLFQVRGNSEYQEDDTLGRPALDPIIGALFPLGLALCLVGELSGSSLFVFTSFCLGFLPALYVVIGEAPFQRRAMAAFPAVFLLAGLALQRLRDALPRLSEARWAAWACAVGLGLCAYEGAHFLDYAHEPGVRRFLNAATSLAADEIRRDPEAKAVILDSLVVNSPVSGFLLPSEHEIFALRRAEEFFFLQGEQEHLLLMAPWMGGMGELLHELYPNAALVRYREEAYADGRYAMDRMRFTHFAAFDPDCSSPADLLFAAHVPSADIEARRGFLDLSTGLPYRGGAKMGQRLRLGALFLLPDEGAELVASRAWAGWSLKLRGRALPWGKPFHLDGRVAFLESEGPVPAHGLEAPPWSLSDGTDVPLSQLAWRPRTGLVADLKGRPRAAQHLHLLLHAFRHGDDLDKRGQEQGSFRARFRPALSGAYRFRFAYPGGGAGKLWVNGTLAFERLAFEEGKPLELQLKAGVPVGIRAELPFDGEKDRFVTMQWEVKAPGAQDWAPIPAKDIEEP